jgi:hypothetical protein
MSSFKTLNGRDYQCARMNYWNSDFFIRCGVHDGYHVWYWWNCWPSLFQLSLHNRVSRLLSIWNTKVHRRYLEKFWSVLYYLVLILCFIIVILSIWIMILYINLYLTFIITDYYHHLNLMNARYITFKYNNTVNILTSQ